MMPGMNPRKMQQMMKRMGIAQQDIEASEVIIRTSDKDIIISNPSVAKVNMMGQETFQISGEIHERELPKQAKITDEDIQTVVDQTGVDKEEARQALENNSGDIAAAILELQS